MTAVFGYVRVSPGTANDGSLQEKKIVILCKLLMESGLVTNFDIKQLGMLHDDGTKRTVGRLFKFIESCPEEEPVFVLISQLNRLGVDETDIRWFLDGVLIVTAT
jgi:hypothetical protein